MLKYTRDVSYHFACFADSLVLVYVSVFCGFLLLYFIHDGINGEAEASHTWQVTDGQFKLQCGVFPCVVRASAALTAHCGFTQKLCSVEEASPHLDLRQWIKLLCSLSLLKQTLIQRMWRGSILLNRPLICVHS